MTLPGLWLSGEVVKEPTDNWDWVLDVAHPERGNTIKRGIKRLWRSPRVF